MEKQCKNFRLVTFTVIIESCKKLWLISLRQTFHYELKNKTQTHTHTDTHTHRQNGTLLIRSVCVAAFTYDLFLSTLALCGFYPSESFAGLGHKTKVTKNLNTSECVNECECGYSLNVSCVARRRQAAEAAEGAVPQSHLKRQTN